MKHAEVLAVVLIFAGPALAEEAEPDGAVKPALTVGLLEVVGLSPETGHFGVYFTASLDLNIKLDDTWMVIPSFGFEFAPEFGNWGGVFLLIVDYFLAEVGSVVLALEPQVGVVHDAVPDGDGFEHHLFVTAGVGLAIVTKRFAVIPQALVTVGTDGEGWALSPTVLFSVPF